MVTFHCRYCQEQTGPVPYPKTDVEQAWLRAFMVAHEGCGVSAVEALRTVGVPWPVAEHETPVPMQTQPHAHKWLAVTPTLTPGIVVRDCGCGHRQRIRTQGGGESEILDDYPANYSTSSFESAILVAAEGKPLRDKWSK